MLSNKSGNWEVLFRASADNGNTFGDKINLSNSSNGHSALKDVAASGNNVFVTYGDNKTGSMETFMRRSTDGGETFADPIVLNSTGTSPLKGTLAPLQTLDILLQTAIAASGENTYIIWWDNKTGNWDIMFARSTDGGETFKHTINLSNSTERSDETIMVADEKNVFVQWWEMDNDGKKQPVLKVSNDNGETFGPILKLAANGTIGG